MKISLSWLSDYIDVAPLRESPAKLKETLDKLTMRGLEVESIQDLKQGFDKVIVARIESRDKHPNADRLKVVRVNVGENEAELVCGAPNIEVGQKVAVAMLGAKLPNGMIMKEVEIRGVKSSGMICAEDELGIGNYHSGIVVLDESAEIGTPFAKAFRHPDAKI